MAEFSNRYGTVYKDHIIFASGEAMQLRYIISVRYIVKMRFMALLCAIFGVIFLSAGLVEFGSFALAAPFVVLGLMGFPNVVLCTGAGDRCIKGLPWRKQAIKDFANAVNKEMLATANERSVLNHETVTDPQLKKKLQKKKEKKISFWMELITGLLGG